MSVLGTMMLRAGLLSESQVTAANEHAANQAFSNVDAILELGLADEDTLVAFLASKLMIPRVRSALLDRVGPTAIAVLPAWLAWEHKCVPVSYDELGNLTVAMTDPTDLRAVTAVAEYTRAYLVRAVGSASELRRALERHYGSEQRARASKDQPQGRGPNSNGPTESDRTTELGLEPVRLQHAPPGIRNPASSSGPAPSGGPLPYRDTVSLAATDSQIGQIPDDDDDVPIRSHQVAHEIASDPARPSAQASARATSDQDTRITENLGPKGPITDVQTGPPPSSPAASPGSVASSRPSGPVAVPVSAPAADDDDDPHTRPTFVETTAGNRGPRRPRSHTPWNPPLQGFSVESVPLSPEAFAQVAPRLDAATDRDQVTTVLLDFLGAGFNRVILFVHSHNELRGLDARGKDLLVEAVRQVRIPSTGKSMFSSVLERGTPYFGPIQGASKIDQAFSGALGGIKGNVLLLPIMLGNKIPLLLWAHGTSHPVDPRSISELGVAVGEAIQRILASARKK